MSSIKGGVLSAAVVFLAAAFLGARQAGAQSVTVLPGGGTGLFDFFDISDDGKVMMGSLENQGPAVWRRGSDLTLSSLPGGPFAYPLGVSGDGKVFMVGLKDELNRVASDGTVEAIGNASEPFYFRSMSYNGSEVVGSVIPAGGVRKAAVWTAEGGVKVLDVPPQYLGRSEATAVSGDGRIVYGVIYPQQTFDPEIPFQWTNESGFQLINSPADWLGLYITKASYDGSILIGGGSDSIEQDGLAVGYTPATGFKFLQKPPGIEASGTMDMTTDGSLILGVTRRPGEFAKPTIWDSTGKPWLLENLLPQLGIDISDYSYFYLPRFSGDGRYLVGSALYQNSRVDGLLIDFGPNGFVPPRAVPEPASMALWGSAAMALFAVLRPRRGSNRG